MTHMDSITKNIQLLYNLLYYYWLSTSEYPTSSRSINYLDTFYILLGTMVNAKFPTSLPLSEMLSDSIQFQLNVSCILLSNGATVLNYIPSQSSFQLLVYLGLKTDT